MSDQGEDKKNAPVNSSPFEAETVILKTSSKLPDAPVVPAKKESRSPLPRFDEVTQTQSGVKDQEQENTQTKSVKEERPRRNLVAIFSSKKALQIMFALMVAVIALKYFSTPNSSTTKLLTRVKQLGLPNTEKSAAELSRKEPSEHISDVPMAARIEPDTETAIRTSAISNGFASSDQTPQVQSPGLRTVANRDQFFQDLDQDIKIAEQYGKSR